MQRLKNKLVREHLLIFVFCAAVIFGPALATFFEYDLSHFPDCKTYLGLAQFDFNQSPVRAYRVIIPFAAAGLDFLFGGIFSKFAPAYFVGNYSLPLCFFIINFFLTAYFGQLVYRYCKAFGVDRLSAAIGTLVLLTCRYTIYTAALPLVDSLFCVIVMFTLLGIKIRNKSMLLWAIFLGPFAKESFIFVAPLIFFFSHLGKKKSFLYLLCSAVLVFGCRYIYETAVLRNAGVGWRADLYHLPNLIRFLPKLLSFYTLGKILMNTGLWILVPTLVIFLKKGGGRELLSKLDAWLIWFIVGVVVQMLLSGSMERMFYLAMPVVCVVVSLSVAELRRVYLPAKD